MEGHTIEHNIRLYKLKHFRENMRMSLFCDRFSGNDNVTFTTWLLNTPIKHSF